jgi:polysaccharide biosynthesis protein PslG
MMDRRRTTLLGSLLLLTVLAVVVGVLLSSGGGAPAPKELLRTPAEQFGANVNWLFNGGGFDEAQIATQLRALRLTGATVARTDVLWERAEPTPPAGGIHLYDWSFDDAIAGSLARAGLRWLAILDYTAPWARLVPTALHSPPRSAAEFGSFAAAFASRYGRGGAFWAAHPDLPQLPVVDYEVWNEPDNGQFWQPLPDAASYAQLYLSSASAIARVDPAADVIVGGLVNASSFLPQMLAARPDLRGRLQGVAIHPYGATPNAVLAKVRRARSALTELGLAAVPLYVTEFGWTVHPAGSLNWAPARLRPSYVSQAVTALAHTNCGVSAVVLYTWTTPQRVLSDKEDWYGLSPPQGGSSADTEAFASAVRRASAPAAVQPVC